MHIVRHCKSAYITQQKCLFYRAKEPVLHCKTMGITMR